MRRSFVPTTRSGKVMAVLLLWYVVVLAGWGIRPMTDHVPVECLAPESAQAEADTDNCHIDHLGERHEARRNERVSQSASCHSPLSNNRSVRGADLPDAWPGWAYEREPCKSPVGSATHLLGFNTAVVVLGCAAAFAWQRTRRQASPAVAPQDQQPSRTTTITAPGRSAD